MSRLATRFAELRNQGRKALIPFITAGDPEPEFTLPLLRALVSSGADVLELGIPFSDPMAEGPVIQRACERALTHGVSLPEVLAMVKAFREEDQETPIVLMGYLNPVECMGYEAFARAAGEAGVDGLITVDLPPEESRDLVTLLRSNQVDPIFLIAPTSGGQRIKDICQLASGFIYYVSLKGVTGAANLDTEAVARKVEEIRACTDLPIGVGFGIRDAETAGRVARVSDAVVVGSALVRRIEDTPKAEIIAAVSSLMKELRRGVDQSTGA